MFNIRRSVALAGLDLRILRRDPVPVTMMTVMPLILMYFLKPLYGGEAGAGQAVPGLTVMFAFFLVGHVGFAFFREHGWGTWDRLRASPLHPVELVLGKALGPLLVHVLQLTVLVGLGSTIFGLPLRSGIGGVIAVAVTFAIFLVAFGVALVGICRSVMQLNAIANVGALLFAGLGGALVPNPLLPTWVQVIAPATPGYWAMRGLRAALVTADPTQVATSVAVLTGMACVVGLVGIARFRVADTKSAWA